MKKTQQFFAFVALVALAALAALALLSTNITQAGDITEAEAQRLQAIFQKSLEDKQAEIAAQTHRPRELVLKGDVTVEAAKTYYAITLPELSLLYPAGNHIDIGLISLNATPDSKPGQFKITMSIPTPIIGFDIAEQETIRITIGSQKSAGIWHEELQAFTKLDSTYNDIQITTKNKNKAATIDNIRIIYDLEEDEDGNLSGPTQLEAKNIKISPDQWTQASLGKIALTVTLDKFSPDIFKKNTDKNVIPALDLADGAALKLQLENLEINKEKPNITTESFSFKQAGINFSYNETSNETINADFGFSFKDASASSIPQALNDFIPKSGQIKLKHNNIPLAVIDETIKNATQGGDTRLLGVSLLLKLPAILAAAESYIELYETNIQNENYNISLDSTIKADSTAANSVTATGVLRFIGLDKILSLAQATKADPSSLQYAAPILSIANFLERVKPLARVETDEQNGFTHIFDLEMNKTGQFSINGENALSLLSNHRQPTQPIQPVEVYPGEVQPLKDME